MAKIFRLCPVTMELCDEVIIREGIRCAITGTYFSKDMVCPKGKSGRGDRTKGETEW